MDIKEFRMQILKASLLKEHVRISVSDAEDFVRQFEETKNDYEEIKHSLNSLKRDYQKLREKIKGL